MRLKFKPNLSAPRGTSTAGSVANGETGGGVRGGSGGSETRRKRQRQRSRGDESAGTEGESSSDIETGDSNVRRRQRRTSERSGSGKRHQAPVTAEKSSSQSSRGNAQKRTESTTSTSGSIEEKQTVVGPTQSTVSSLPSASKVVSESTDGGLDRRQTTSSEKSPGEIQTSSAGQVQSTADSALQTLGSSLTRGNSAAVASGRAAPRIKKKVAPKVVSSRPRKATSSVAVVDGCAPVSNQASSQRQKEEVSINVTKTGKGFEDRDVTTHNASEGGDGSLSHEAGIDSEESALNSTSLLTTNASTNQTSDEVISNTLNEVLCNTHSQEPEDIGLAGIVPSRLGLFGGLTPSEDLQGDAILISAQHSSHTEIEVRTENADVSKRSDGQSDRNVALSVNSEPLNSENCFIFQSCTDGVERTSQSPQSKDKTGQTSQSTSPSQSTQLTGKSGQTSQSTSPSQSPQSKDKAGQTNQSTSPSQSAQTTKNPGQTSRSTSPSSSQEPQSSGRSRRSVSASERSQRSESRASSVCSEASGEGGSETTSTSQSGLKGKKRQRRKKTPTDSNEPNSQGTSPQSKRARLSAVKVREAPDRSTMTMQELIYYNPTANPMSSSVEEKKRKKEDGQSGNGQESRASSVQPGGGSRGTSPANQEARGEEGDGDQSKDDEGGQAGRIVPTLRIGMDGKIIVDETSMMMETTQQDTLEDMGEVVLDSTGHTTSASYRQRCRVTRWTKEETGRFFKALSQVGTDFTMMTLLIPKRTRKELKNKFKKEERSNPHLVSQALSRT